MVVAVVVGVGNHRTRTHTRACTHPHLIVVPYISVAVILRDHVAIESKYVWTRGDLVQVTLTSYEFGSVWLAEALWKHIRIGCGGRAVRPAGGKSGGSTEITCFRPVTRSGCQRRKPCSNTDDTAVSKLPDKMKDPSRAEEEARRASWFATMMPPCAVSKV